MNLSENDRKIKAKLLMECIGSPYFSDEEQEILHEMVDKIIPDPEWSGYIFWPQKYGVDGSIDAAIEKAFSYKPIILAPPEEK